MNEYEISDLLISNRILEQQQYALLQSQLEILSGSFEMFMTILFGYLIAAHFIGAKLS